MPRWTLSLFLEPFYLPQTDSSTIYNEMLNLALEHLGYAKDRYDIIHPNDHVNKCQSTNDAYPTGFRLGLYAAVQGLEAELCEHYRPDLHTCPWPRP